MAKAKINPEQWLAVANVRRPKTGAFSEWFVGNTHPQSVGWFERHFERSKGHQNYLLSRQQSYQPKKSSQWWDGVDWRVGPNGAVDPLGVGAYPSWRGMSRQFCIGDEVTLLRGSRGRTSGLGCERRIRARLDSIDSGLNVFCTLLEDDPLATVDPKIAGQSGMWGGLSSLV